MSPLLNLTNVSVGYENKDVLQKVNLTVHASDFVGIIGPNGGGKTTLLKVILGLLTPSDGSVYMKPGVRVGYLPQINSIDKKFPITVQEVVLSGRFNSSTWWRKASKQQLNKMNELLDYVGMTSYRHKAIGELSGGQMQRVFLCRALISQPQLLILDEPSTYVDKQFEASLYQLLSELNKEMAVILVSHDVGTITSIVKTIACVNGGLHYHPSNTITDEQLKVYNCPIELVSHGHVPHRVLKHHTHD